MDQFLSINFFFISSIFVGFSNVTVYLCHPVLNLQCNCNCAIQSVYTLLKPALSCAVCRRGNLVGTVAQVRVYYKELLVEADFGFSVVQFPI